MELKTKYQYTYFIYPYFVEKKDYVNYLHSLLRKPECELKLFDKKKDIQIDSYFLPEIKNKMFWSLYLSKEGLRDYNSLDNKMKATVLSKKEACIFEYNIREDIPAKIGEGGGIFFDINRMEIICFSTGLCFLLVKTMLSEGSNFSDVLNFNYKFRDIQSKIVQPREYDNIKIQTTKFRNMQTFSNFIERIAGSNLKAKKVNLDTNRLITYSYTCLESESWNENTNPEIIEKEFEKYYRIRPAGEQTVDAKMNSKQIYQEKYAYYGFSNNSTMLLTSASNMKNYTNLLFEYENEGLYHFIYNLYKKIYLKQLNYEFSQTSNFKSIQQEFINFSRNSWTYEVTNNDKGIILERYYSEAQNLDETFEKLKNGYDLLYKEYNIERTNKHNKWIAIAVAIVAVVSLINMFIN